MDEWKSGDVQTLFTALNGTMKLLWGLLHETKL